MSLENAKANLKEFGKELNKQGDQLKAKGADTCIPKLNEYLDKLNKMENHFF